MRAVVSEIVAASSTESKVLLLCGGAAEHTRGILEVLPFDLPTAYCCDMPCAQRVTTRGGCSDYYHPLRDSCGEHSLPLLRASQSSPPSPIDAQPRNHEETEDETDCVSEHSRLAFDGHLSTPNDPFRAADVFELERNNDMSRTSFDSHMPQMVRRNDRKSWWASPTHFQYQTVSSLS